MNLTEMIFDNAKHYFPSYLEKFSFSDFLLNCSESLNEKIFVFSGNDVDITCSLSNIDGKLLIIVSYFDNGLEKFAGICLDPADFV